MFWRIELSWRVAIASLGAVAVSVAPARVEAQTRLQAVIIVRHGEKAEAPKENPPLSPAGQARAQALLETLRDARLTTIITTDQERTRATAAPLAATLHLTAVIVPRSPDPKKDAVAVAEAVRRAGGTVLVVSHQLTIPLIIAALGGPTIPTMCDSEFSNLYVLVVENLKASGLVRGHYGIPDPSHAPDCHISPVSPP
jgi:broad specificity phosphatase PhoE